MILICFLQADISKDIEFGIKLDNFEVCRELLISTGTRSFKVRLKMVDSQRRPLELYVSVLARTGGSLKVVDLFISCFLIFVMMF